MTSPFKKPAFMSTVPRFTTMTLHYNLDPLGIFVKKPLACDPGKYNPQSVSEAYERIRKSNVKKDPWRFKFELEAWCKNLGYRNQAVLERRKYYASIGGPAWPDIPEPIPYEPVCKNVGFGRVPRFKISKSQGYPGPATYFRKEYKAPYGPHSTRPTMLREEPCRFPDSSPPWSLAPDRYRIYDPDSIENKPKKLVSRKGPYELFSGKRDDPTRNHFGKAARVSTKSWPVSLPGSFEGLKKSHAGEWNKTGRDKPPRHRIAVQDLTTCPRRMPEPTATTYFKDLTEYKFVQNKKPFNSSHENYDKVIVWPGVGRYHMDRRSMCGIFGQGYKHVFLSKAGRTIGSYPPEKMNTF